MEEPTMKRCPHCKKEIPAEMGYCLHCMARLDTPQTVEPPRRTRRWLLPVIGAAVVLIAGTIGAVLLWREKTPSSGKLPTAGQTAATTTSTITTTAAPNEWRMYLSDLVGMNFRYVTSLMGVEFTRYDGEGFGCVYQDEGLIFYYEYPEGDALSDEDVCISAEIYGDRYIAGDIHTAVSITELQTTALSYGAYDVGAYEDVENADKRVVYFKFKRDGNLYEVYATYDYGADTPERVLLKLIGQE